MKAMVLAAGLGTRLRPVTHAMPKCLVPIYNRPLISIILKHLAACGIEDVVVNAHHLMEKVTGFFEDSHPPLPVEISRERLLLDTGGGIKKVLDFFGKEPFCTMHGDVLTDLDPRDALTAHRDAGNLATMVLGDIPGFNNVEIDHKNNIVGFLPKEESSKRLLAFTGMQVMDASFFKYAPEGRVFSILDVYRNAIAKGERIRGHIAGGFFWAEVGSIRGLLDCHERLTSGGPFFPEKHMETFPVVVHPDANIAADVEISGFAAIGARARVGEGAVLSNVVVLADTDIAPGERLDMCIAGPGFRAEANG